MFIKTFWIPREINNWKKTIEDYAGYDRIKLRQRAREIIDDDNTPDMHKLIYPCIQTWYPDEQVII